MIQEINRILDHGRIAPIILRRHEHVRRVSRDLLAPGARVRVRVGAGVRDLRGEEGLVEEGERVGEKVEGVEGVGGVRGGGGGGEGGGKG